MSDISKTIDSASEEAQNLKFSDYLTSRVVTITVAKTKTFHLHFDLLVAESERFSTQLKGSFKEAVEGAIRLEDEDPALFGFFGEYIYRDDSLLSRKVGHYSEYVILARLYALGERLLAPRFQAHCLWRFTESLSGSTTITDECVCHLLEIATTEITERVTEDSLTAQIFWYGAIKIESLQNFTLFCQLCRDISEIGRQLVLKEGKKQPSKPPSPGGLRFESETEEVWKRSAKVPY